MADPIIDVVRFHREHDKPANQQPRGQLNRGQGVQSLGYFRGANLAIGQLVVVYTRNAKKVWTGSITQRVADRYSPAEGDAFFFSVVILKNEADPDQGEETIAVTVTDPTDPSDTSKTAQPQPDVP
ncbi:MAG TPA: hypothetical protein VFG68_15025 [Fimbriiglobus sp.]|nr:hypothetical protein [Fimbriiglobus sp.]